MLHDYDDIRARVGTEPRWYTETGVPRYCAHHPKECPDIYADEVALLEIECQACGESFDVQMSSDEAASMLRVAVWARRLGVTLVADRIKEIAAEHALSRFAKDGSIHFGDPPRHNCAAGETMNCNDIQVIEFWRRVNFEWVRVPELEGVLPDADVETPAGEQEGPL